MNSNLIKFSHPRFLMGIEGVEVGIFSGRSCQCLIVGKINGGLWLAFSLWSDVVRKVSW